MCSICSAAIVPQRCPLPLRQGDLRFRRRTYLEIKIPRGHGRAGGPGSRGLQRRHALDVVSHREQVERPLRGESVSVSLKGRHVPGQCGWVTADIHDGARCSRRDLADDVRACPGARWIQHDDVGPVRRWPGQCSVHPLGDQLDVWLVMQIATSVPYRVGGGLDRHYRTRFTYLDAERAGEQSDTAVEIQYALPRLHPGGIED